MAGPGTRSAPRAPRRWRSARDLYEGNAPHGRATSCPTTQRAARRTSSSAARDLDEALTTLLIAYTQVPSITRLPGVAGRPRLRWSRTSLGLDDDELHRRLRLFWISLDRTPDASHDTLGGPDGAPPGARARSRRCPTSASRSTPRSRRPGPDAVGDGLRLRPAALREPTTGRRTARRRARPPATPPAAARTRWSGSTSPRSRCCTRAPRESYLDGAAAPLRRAHGPGTHLVEEARFSFDHSWLVTTGCCTSTATPRCWDLRAGRGGVASPGARGASPRALPRGRLPRAVRVVTGCSWSPPGRCPLRGVRRPRAAAQPESGIDSDLGGPRLPDPGSARSRGAPAPDRDAAPLPGRDQRRAGVRRDPPRRNPAAVVDVVRGAFRTAALRLLHLLSPRRQQRLHPDHRLPGQRPGRARPRGAARHTGAGSVAESHVDRRDRSGWVAMSRRRSGSLTSSRSRGWTGRQPVRRLHAGLPVACHNPAARPGDAGLVRRRAPGADQGGGALPRGGHVSGAKGDRPVVVRA